MIRHEGPSAWQQLGEEAEVTESMATAGETRWANEKVLGGERAKSALTTGEPRQMKRSGHS